MNRPLVIHPRADLDQLECFSFLAKNSPDAARRFLEAIDSILPTIGDKPHAGHRYLSAKRENEDWRYVRVPGFRNYLIFYRISDEQIEVVRVIHGSRDLESIFRVL